MIKIHPFRRFEEAALYVCDEVVEVRLKGTNVYCDEVKVISKTLGESFVRTLQKT